jgi:hypothetical protein
MSHKRKHKTKENTKVMCRDTTNMEHEIYYHTGNNWRLRNSNVRLEEKFGDHTRKTFNRFATKDSCTGNITHSTERTAV